MERLHHRMTLTLPNGAIWHFKGDTMVPFEAARRSAEQLTQVTRLFIKGNGHIATNVMLEDMTAVLAHT